MIDLDNVKSNDTRCKCKNNSNREQTHGNPTRKARTSNIPSIFNVNFKINLNPFSNKSFMILFTIFSIILPIGIQPQLQANYAFGEINSQSKNHEVEYSDEGQNSSYSSNSEPILKLNVNEKNPFDSTIDDGNKKVKMDIIIPDIVGPDLVPETQPSSTPDHETSSNTQSSEEHINPDSVDKNSKVSDSIDNTDNIGNSAYADDNLTIEQDNPATSELSSTDSQIATLENSETELDSQPTHKSYRDYVGNSDANKNNDDVVVPSNKVDIEITAMNSSINPDIGNDSGNADDNLILQENQTTTTTQSEFTGSQFKLDSQPKYKSYRDYMEKNNLIKNEIKINVPAEIEETESSSADNSIPFFDTSKKVEPNNELTMKSYSASTASSQVTAQASGEIYGDFNGDGRDDLAIGVPFEDVDTGAGTIDFAGAVNVLYGSSNGLSATSPRSDQFWTQNSADVNDLVELGDTFGFSINTGDFNGDGRDDLAIGVPFEDVDTGAGTITNAGAVNVLYGSSNGLSATSPRSDQFWTQNSADVNDSVEELDNFGLALG